MRGGAPRLGPTLIEVVEAAEVIARQAGQQHRPIQLFGGKRVAGRKTDPQDANQSYR